MKPMSFYLTTTAVRNRTKTQTLRLGWRTVKPGDRLRAVVKAQGLRRGQEVEYLATIEVTAVSRRPLQSITPAEVAAEGFPDKTPAQFVQWFCMKLKTQPTLVVTFITFTYLD